MKILVSIIFIILFRLTNAQESTFILHPSVGDTISRFSKSKYLLFPEIKDSLFEYCNIKVQGQKFFVITHFINGTVTENEIQQSELNQYWYNIEKLNEYYVNKENQDTTVLKNNSHTGNPPVNKSLAAPGLTDQQKSEILRDARLKSDQEKMKNYQNGTESAPGGIEISTGKKKK
jgi:hypothetical protein